MAIFNKTFNPFDRLNESEELKWAEDLFNMTHDGWQLLNAGLKNYQDFNVRIVIKDYSYLMCGIRESDRDDDFLIDIIKKQPNYEFKLLDFDKVKRDEIDCGCADNKDDIVEAVLLEYENGLKRSFFWFLKEWVDLIFIPKNINESKQFEQEYDLEWAKNVIKEPLTPKWVKLRDGLDFIIPNDPNYNSWQKTVKTKGWHKVNDVMMIIGPENKPSLCYSYQYYGYLDMRSPVNAFAVSDVSYSDIKPN